MQFCQQSLINCSISSCLLYFSLYSPVLRMMLHIMDPIKMVSPPPYWPSLSRMSEADGQSYSICPAREVVTIQASPPPKKAWHLLFNSYFIKGLQIFKMTSPIHNVIFPCSAVLQGVYHFSFSSVFSILPVTTCFFGLAFFWFFLFFLTYIFCCFFSIYRNIPEIFGYMTLMKHKIKGVEN